MSGIDYLIVGLAGLAAGLVNALAGGGTLLSFPALTAVGLPPVAANVTSTVALWPGFVGGSIAQARDLRGQRRRLAFALPAGALGGLAGGLLLLETGDRVFQTLVPWLILAACGLLAVQPVLRRWVDRRLARRPAAGGRDLRTAATTGLAAIYGGYFGAGLGVILLATLGLVIDDTLTRLNALKQTIALAANLAAAVFFVLGGPVDWPAAIVMAIGSLAGGALGGRVAGQVSSGTLRGLVIAVGFVAAIYYLAR